VCIGRGCFPSPFLSFYIYIHVYFVLCLSLFLSCRSAFTRERIYAVSYRVCNQRERQRKKKKERERERERCRRAFLNVFLADGTGCVFRNNSLVPCKCYWRSRRLATVDRRQPRRVITVNWTVLRDMKLTEETNSRKCLSLRFSSIDATLCGERI